MQRKCTDTCDFTENCTKHHTTYQKFTPLTQKLCLQRLAVTDISSDFTLKHPLCPPKSAKLSIELLTCLKARVSHGLFHWHCWAGALAGNQGEQYLAEEKGVPPLWKKSVLTTATLAAPLLLLPLTLRRNHHHLPPWYWLYWGYGPILAILNFSLKFSLCPSLPHYTQRQDDTCTAPWERSFIYCSTEKCETCPRNPEGSPVSKRNPCIPSTIKRLN